MDMHYFAMFVAIWSGIAFITRVYDAIDYRESKSWVSAGFWFCLCGWAVYVLSTLEVPS